MTATEQLLEQMGGWLRTVARKFMGRQSCNAIDEWDFFQEASLAILKKGAVDEALAKVVALRAMRKYRDRFGEERVTHPNGGPAHRPLNRLSEKALQYVTVAQEPEGVFWENLRGYMTPIQYRTLLLWAESDLTAAEIGTIEGASAGTIKNRLHKAIQLVKDKWSKHDRPA